MRVLKVIVGFLILLAALPALPVQGQEVSPRSKVTSYAQMTAQLQADTAHSRWMQLVSVGKSVRGRPLWLVRLADPQSAPADTTRLLVLCRQHGDEPASTEALLGLIHHFALGEQTPLTADLAHVTLYIAPMVNPDGAEAGTRRNAVHADLNRDWGLFTQPETQAMARVISLVHPNVVVDAHNWDGGDSYNTDCIEVSRALFTPLGRMVHGLQQQSVQSLAESGYHVMSFAYGPERDLRLAHRWCTQQGMVSMLVETHAGSPQDSADFTHRQKMYVLLVNALAHHYAMASPAETQAVQRLPPGAFSAAREAALFPARPEKALSIPEQARQTAFPLRPARSWTWLWVIAAYGLTLWACGVGRGEERITVFRAHWRERRPGYVPATEKRSAVRHDKPRYRYSRKTDALPPAPVAYGHRR